MLHLKGIAKAYPTKTVLAGVDWHVAPGQRWGLVGPNGAGKSTLIKIILGQMDADAGSVALRPRLEVGHLFGAHLRRSAAEPAVGRQQRTRDLQAGHGPILRAAES